MELLKTIINKEAIEEINHKEGKLAKFIEAKASKIPTDIFLWTALASAVASVVFKFQNKQHVSLLIGQWTSHLLLFGIYNKLIKLHGSER